MVPGPAPSASPKQLFEMQVFGPHPRPAYLQTGCGNLHINKPLQEIQNKAKSESHCFEQEPKRNRMVHITQKSMDIWSFNVIVVRSSYNVFRTLAWFFLFSSRVAKLLDDVSLRGGKTLAAPGLWPIFWLMHTQKECFSLIVSTEVPGWTFCPRCPHWFSLGLVPLPEVAWSVKLCVTRHGLYVEWSEL